MKWVATHVDAVVTKTNVDRAMLTIGGLQVVMTRAEAIALAMQLADVAEQLVSPGTPGMA
ncbi:hypothetical protein AO501_29800 [Mycobacterium gordonae]|uniref:Uncharacterized protein n=1 Tax=Mycobacterium gordonae TaxID=1778 RepID=A0A0Q2QTE1_MYCGO|nr:MULTISPECIES: hypothetical protein [Mycobacterium]KQH75302.1 hypothetical protein AO501_29800 [Mycobacterium gordonae]MDP7726873.1 hypothetical protein [Mycobacterium sp. TY813]